MSDQKRPQLAPEVLDPPSTQATGTKAGTDKELRSYAANTTLVSTEQVGEPKPKAIGPRPIVEVSPNADIRPVDVKNSQPVPPIARPIVEISAEFRQVDTKNSHP